VVAAAAGGLLVVAVAVGVVLSRSEERLVGTNSDVTVSRNALPIAPRTQRCALNQLIPAGAAAVNVYAGTGGRSGGALRVSISGPNGLLATGAAARVADGPLRIALHPVSAHEVDGARVCLRNDGPGQLTFAGNLTPFAPGTAIRSHGPEVIRTDWLHAGRRSGWQMAGTVTRRYALAKGGSVGRWTPWALLVALAGGIGAAVALAALAPRSALRAALACAAIAGLNAGIWALTTPAFQVPDETSHVGYVQYLAETGRPPPPNAEPHRFSREEAAAVAGVGFAAEGRPIWSERRDADLRRTLAAHLSRVEKGGAGPAAAYPPLYYAYEALGYRAAEGANLLDRLLVMRLLSALLAAATAGFVLLFVRELLPGSPRAWALGGLAVAFQPLLGFLGGGVNNDNLLFTASACLLWLFARAFRRGLDPRLGIAIGATLVVALLTKRNAFGLLPGAAAGLALLAWRPRPENARAVRRGALAAAAIVVVPTLAYVAVTGLTLDRSLGDFLGIEQASGTSLSGQLSYAWQQFFPPLPFMQDQFQGTYNYPPWDVYFTGLVGRFGWFQYGFAPWVNSLAAGVAAALAALTGAALMRNREALRRRRAEAACYAAFAAGLLIVLAVAGYRWRLDTGASFEQARYLLPLLPLYGGAVALAARGSGRRLEPFVTGVLVALVAGHTVFALLITLGRFYT
jgi:hypothetical protein